MQKKARIYQPSRTAMQSGKAKTRQWVLEMAREKGRYKDPTMGWTGTTSTLPQICIKFKSLEEATQYAARHDIEATVVQPHTRKFKIKRYSDNFRYDRPLG